MKKLSICISAFIVLLVLPLSAFDWGSKLNNTTKMQGNDFTALKLYQSDSLHLWFMSLVNEQNSIKLSGDGSYEYRYDQSDDSVSYNIADVNLLKISGTFSVGNGSNMEMAGGRFMVSDATGILFSQICDGLYTKWTLPAAEFSIYGGCTNLLNMQDVSIILPSSASYKPDYTKIYVTGPSYIPFGVSVNLPSLFLNQNLLVEGWGFADYSGDEYNRWYGTFEVSGPLSGHVFYSATSTVGTEKFTTVSDLSKVSFAVYPGPEASVILGGLYASGKNGIFNPFVGFTSQTADMALDEPEYSSMIEAMLSASYIIMSRVCLTAEGDCVFSCPESEVSYDGWQWKFNAGWNIFNDVQVSFGGYQYYAADSARNKSCFSLTGTMVF
jgi:hypothetical protein